MAVYLSVVAGCCSSVACFFLNIPPNPLTKLPAAPPITAAPGTPLLESASEAALEAASAAILVAAPSKVLGSTALASAFA
ncbi:MAG: hypothetical protein H6996_09520 [Moraxellaceae bacterium]|nr:hypothetical protein [Moraxellaceae bacterium]